MGATLLLCTYEEQYLSARLGGSGSGTGRRESNLSM